LFTVEWSKQKQLGITSAEMSIQELDENLRQFYAKARHRNGENYSRATLLSLRNGIERFLNSLQTTVAFPLTLFCLGVGGGAHCARADFNTF